MKTCTKCKLIKELSEFSKDKYKKDNLSSSCNLCNRARSLKWQKDNKKEYNERNRKWYYDNRESRLEYSRNLYHKIKHNDKYKERLQRYKESGKVKDKHYARYGMTFNDYSILLEKQRNTCKICSQSQSRRKLAVDHCHKTGKIRGLLCDKCNLILGKVKDSIQILEFMVNYLKESENLDGHEAAFIIPIK